MSCVSRNIFLVKGAIDASCSKLMLDKKGYRENEAEGLVTDEPAVSTDALTNCDPVANDVGALGGIFGNYGLVT
ncbi:hypothetical protein L6452_26207 [Arctium lappa]|uniref:Uncharacterized protein n=1 Tax=Arctium lappa TaxID=4217 RepID=A0ACB9ACW7_ARCLA|nr:hypothetical protein L6452_26207 [Arctium lappa]